MTSQALQIAKQVMKEDHELLDVLGSENFTQIKKQKRENIIDEIIKLVPESTEGKVLTDGSREPEQRCTRRHEG